MEDMRSEQAERRRSGRSELQPVLRLLAASSRRPFVSGMEPPRPNASSSHRHFVLNGFDELGVLRPVLFVPFSVLLGVSLSANSLLLYVVASRRRLHSPMYVLMAGMAGVDLVVPLFFVPHMLLSFLLDWRGISLMGCLLQMHCVHFVASFQCTLLVWMALDRYFAICTPLRYQERMAPLSFLKFVVPLVVRNLVAVTLFVGLAGRLSFCSPAIGHCFCEHMALVGVACGDTRLNSLAGLTALILIPVVDFVLIVASYVFIFASVLSSGKSSSKALRTCVTHIVVMVVSLTVTLVALLSYRVRNRVPAAVLVFFSTMYLLVPSCFNPIIYGIRTAEIRQHILQMLRCPVPTVDPAQDRSGPRLRTEPVPT